MKRNIKILCTTFLFSGFVGCQTVGDMVGQSPLTSEDISQDLSPSISGLSADSVRSIRNRGKYLVTAVAGCQNCHGENLAAGKVFVDTDGVQFSAPNITPDTETGIGSWTLADFVAVLRSGVSRSGEELRHPVHQGYKRMSDSDARAIGVFLLSIKPQPGERAQGLPQTSEELSARLSDLGYVSDLRIGPSAGYGRYLVSSTAGCASCHSKSEDYKDRFSGGHVALPNLETAYAPSLKGSKIAGKAEADFLSFLAGEVLSSEGKCPQPYFSKMTLGDRVAIAKYITLPRKKKD